MSATSRAFGALTGSAAPLARRAAMRRLQARFTNAHVALYRLLGGRVVGRLGAAPLLLLTTSGRRSGKRRTVPVIYVPGPDPALIASNGGAARHPLWFLNLQASPRATLEIEGERREVLARVAAGHERERLWRRAVELYPSYASYQERTAREIPVVVLARAG